MILEIISNVSRKQHQTQITTQKYIAWTNMLKDQTLMLRICPSPWANGRFLGEVEITEPISGMDESWCWNTKGRMEDVQKNRCVDLPVPSRIFCFRWTERTRRASVKGNYYSQKQKHTQNDATRTFTSAPQVEDKSSPWQQNRAKDQLFRVLLMQFSHWGFKWKKLRRTPACRHRLMKKNHCVFCRNHRN